MERELRGILLPVIMAGNEFHHTFCQLLTGLYKKNYPPEFHETWWRAVLREKNFCEWVPIQNAFVKQGIGLGRGCPLSVPF